MKQIIQKLALVGLALATLSGCSNVREFYHDTVDVGGQLGLLPDHRLQRANHYVFQLASGFYVSWNDPDVFRADAGSESGGVSASPTSSQLEQDTAALLYQQLAAHFPRVALARSAQSVAVARVSAARQHLEYVIFPRLILLHDAVGSGRSMTYAAGTRGMQRATVLAKDRAELQLTVLETGSGRIVDVVTFDSRNGLLSVPGRTPQDLLHTALSSYVDSLVPHT